MRSNKKRKKHKTNASISSKAVNKNYFHRIESFLKKWKFTIALVVCFVSAAGWFMEYIKQDGQESPTIEIYNNAVENLDKSILSYYQTPAYKDLIIEYGGAFRFLKSYTIAPKKIGVSPFLFIKLEGEVEARAFDLSQVVTIPFTLKIENRGIRSLLAVEKIVLEGVQVRTFRSIEHQ